MRKRWLGERIRRGYWEGKGKKEEKRIEDRSEEEEEEKRRV
jgi:hypothetical protein